MTDPNYQSDNGYQNDDADSDTSSEVIESYTDPKPVGTGEHVIVAGECLESIAMRTGHFWETLWKHGDNSELKSEREDPNLLLPGDRLTIPEIRKKSESAADQTKHRFRRKGVPSKFQVTILEQDEPRADEDYVLDIDGTVTEGTTDSNGYLEESMPPDSRCATVTMGEDRYVFELGDLDPISTVRGLKSRLKTMGYQIDNVDSEVSPDLIQAVEQFQVNNDLDPTGKADSETRDKIVEVFGS